MTSGRHSAVAAATLISLQVMTPAQAQSVPVQPELSQPSPAPNLTREQRRRQLEMAVRLAKVAAKPKVVCGTTIIPANPNVDRDLVKPVPDQSTKFTLRPVPRTACG